MNFLYALILACSLAASLAAQTVGGAERRRAEAGAHYAAAQARERAGDWAAAEKEWQLTLSIEPQDARAQDSHSSLSLLQ